ncbi:MULTISPECIES: hypothetical protein [unclassified Hyphomonas]|jgi:hypothetical protein|uniref:hypothetical protein n=1 Tax=unclassified Hyphomonas TaxID=2630699 RepID=UPI000458E0B6|nr:MULTISPECIES: hypothetical protein [unclassified Hyphomonas]KCZ48017.1 hypothetical protein HY17_18385 [Hyphomonas sp. CY54-11-8]
MQLERSDLIGSACAALALGLIAWLSLDSWAITRCEEILSADPAGEAGPASPERAKCLRRQNQRPVTEN